MSIQSQKEDFMRECEVVMRLEKQIIEKITSKAVRGEHHAEQAYMACEELRKVFGDVRPEQINSLKRGGFGKAEDELSKLKNAVKVQKDFYKKQVEAARDVAAYASSILETFSFCDGLITKIEGAISNMDKILRALKSL